MESFEARLALDAEYQELMIKCREAAWGEGGYLPGSYMPSNEYLRLCELREARYMALKREWEAGQ